MTIFLITCYDKANELIVKKKKIKKVGIIGYKILKWENEDRNV